MLATIRLRARAACAPAARACAQATRRGGALLRPFERCPASVVVVVVGDSSEKFRRQASQNLGKYDYIYTRTLRHTGTCRERENAVFKTGFPQCQGRFGLSGARALARTERDTPRPDAHATLGLKSPKDLFFCTRGGLVRHYERAIALPPRPRVGRARAAFFSPVIPASAAVAPLNGGE